MALHAATSRYVSEIARLVAIVHESEGEAITRAARLVARAITRGGFVRPFGTGHSHLIAEEGFFRAGGLVPVQPILEPFLMLHEGPQTSTRYERTPGLAKLVFEKHLLGPNDVLIVISNSGVNAVPVEMAKLAKDAGIPVIAVTSREYSEHTPARNPLGARLIDLADVVLDNHLPPGDALVALEETGLKMGPGSTVIGALLLHCVFIEASAIIAESGASPPVMLSANMPDAASHNEKVFAPYRQHFTRL